MWHIVYIIAFAVLAIMAIANLVRNLIVLGGNARNPQRPGSYGGGPRPNAASGSTFSSTGRSVPQPELLDQDGQMIREPLLVMKSISVKDAREQLEALYNGTDDDDEDID